MHIVLLLCLKNLLKFGVVLLDRLPDVVLKEGQADYGKPKEVNLRELLAGKKVAIFAVPGKLALTGLKKNLTREL